MVKLEKNKKMTWGSGKTVFGSGVARAFPGGRPAHPEPQIEEENEEKLRKDERKSRRKRKIEEMLLSCPPGVESLATPLVFGELKVHDFSPFLSLKSLKTHLKVM